MDLMSVRRGLLSSDGYIRSGLVLWMDGIEKGNTSGAWTDKACGHVFTAVNGFTNGSNYVGLSSSSSQYFRNTTFDGSDYRQATIEVVTADYQNKTLLFMPIAEGRMAFGIFGQSTPEQIISSTASGIKVINFTNGAKIFSITNNTDAVVDGVVATFGSNNAWGGANGTYNYIGRRSSGNYFTGKIYAIRIYERKLTVAEMLHNQRIDNRRFKLGLTI